MLLENKKWYQSKLLKIPTPEFIVLYNGKAPYPDYAELKLSNAFINTEGLKQHKKDNLPLELVVKVYNIHHGRNTEMMSKSKTLGNYSFFVGKVNDESREKPLEEAVKDAIKYCIENNILKEFLVEHTSEVTNMLMGEWNWDDAKEVWQEEAREEGLEQGLEQGREEGKAEIIALMEKGLSLDEIKNMQKLNLS